MSQLRLARAQDMRLAWEEPFGPVIPVIRVKSVEEAVDHCNTNNLALQGCVFTTNVDRAIAISDAMETGTVQARAHMRFARLACMHACMQPLPCCCDAWQLATCALKLATAAEKGMPAGCAGQEDGPVVTAPL